MKSNTSDNNTVLICLEDSSVLAHTVSSIKSYFDNSLYIVSSSPSTLHNLPCSPYAAVVSDLTVDKVKKRFPDTKIIMQEWDLSGQALEKVVSLPAGSNVLVVNKPLSAAEETRNSLLELGINHINLISYNPDNLIDASQIDAIIYVGLIDHCPKLNCPYIDIGMRKTSIYTIIDIVRTFSFPSNYVKDYNSTIMQQFAASCYRIDRSLKQVNALKDNFEKICNINNNITFVLNQNDDVVLFNEVAKKYFEIKDSQQIIGEKYTDVFKEYPELLLYISHNDYTNDTLITIDNQKLLISSFKMDVGKDQNNAFTLLPLSTLQKREGLVRKKLQATGFVAQHTFDDIIGSSEPLKHSKSLANIYSKTDFPILITGESGTGKELFAQAIHNASSRKESNFVAINFAVTGILG